MIPYTTFPNIDLGFITLRTFGLMVALGVVVGAWVGGRVAQTDCGISQDETYRLTTRMVIAAMIGARLTWVVTHWDQIDNPIDVIAVWEGGLQFAGGFIAAVAVGIPVVRHWRGRKGWGAADSYMYGLTIGMAIGRIGCYAVGEHFGSESDFFLATRWDGGPDPRELTLGDVPLELGMSFHNTALYEIVQLMLLFGVLTLLRRRQGPGRHHGRGLLPLVRRGPAADRLPTGQRRHGARAHRRPIPGNRPDLHRAVDPVPGAPPPGPGDGRCRGGRCRGSRCRGGRCRGGGGSRADRGSRGRPRTETEPG